jgi:hypothetical protein
VVETTYFGVEKILSRRVSIPAIPFVEGVSGAAGTAEAERKPPMSVTTPTLTASHHSAQPTSSLRRTTVAVGLAGAAVTAAVAAAVHAAGVPLAVDGEMIPLAGFAQLTFGGAVVGGLIAAFLKRRSAAVRRRFLQTTGMLTALSCVPSIALPPDVATKLALVATHVIAATIIVPVLARQLDD